MTHQDGSVTFHLFQYNSPKTSLAGIQRCLRHVRPLGHAHRPYPGESSYSNSSVASCASAHTHTSRNTQTVSHVLLSPWTPVACTSASVARVHDQTVIPAYHCTGHVSYLDAAPASSIDFSRIRTCTYQPSFWFVMP